MRIAQVTQAQVSVPPLKYGGTELVASLLTEELVRKGHDLTLFATGDSQTKARLHYLYKEAMGFDTDAPIRQMATVSEAFEYINADGSFDIIHSHAGHWGIVLSRFSQTPVVTTLHNDYFIPGDPAFEYFKDTGNYVAISRNQMERLVGLNFAGMVYNAIDTSCYVPTIDKDDYLLFFGNMNKAKGVDVAVKVARELQQKLIISSKVNNNDADKVFFETEIKPYIDNKHIIFYPPVAFEMKHELFRKAKCFLFPINWQEPFGLVMIEAMACGTPVVAYDNGSVPEVIKDGVTGFVTNNYEDFRAAVQKVDQISPEACRKHVEENFSVAKMADRYLRVYRKVVEGRG